MTDDVTRNAEDRETVTAADVEFGLALVLIAGAATNRAVSEGRYPEFTEAQRRELIRANRIKAMVLVRRRVPVGRAFEEAVRFAELAVRIVMGVPAWMN